MGKLVGKVAVVTGGNSGMGLATAKLFVREGARVVITGRDQATLDAAVHAMGDSVFGLRADISKMNDLDRLREFVNDRYGRVDVIFANAGGGRPNSFDLMTEEEFDFTVDTNFKGTFFTVQKLLPLMRSGGSIILNTSTLSGQGRPYVSAYAASKAAIRSLARSMTAELSDRRIRVNAVAPGFIDTDQMRKIGMSEDAIEHTRRQAHDEIPMHRSGTVEEIASAVLFLASDDSTYITGSELSVDGGWSQV